MNAGGVPNTCKSNEALCIRTKVPSGGRVSNTLVTYPEVGDNPGKLGLIPYVIQGVRVFWMKGLRFASGGACGPSASW